MYSFENLQIGNIDVKTIKDFKIVENSIFGFEKAIIAIKSKLTQKQLFDLSQRGAFNIIKTDSNRNCYFSYLEKAEYDELGKQTYLHFANLLYSQQTKYDGTTTLVTTIADFVENVMKPDNAQYIGYTGDTLFSATLTADGHFFNKIETIENLMIYCSFTFYEELNKWEVEQHDRLFIPLKNDYNMDNFSSTLISLINNYEIDYYLNDENFHFTEQTFFGAKGGYTVHYGNNGSYYKYYDLNFRSAFIEIHLPNLLSANIETFNRYDNWASSIYNGIVGRIYKKHFHLEVNDVVTYNGFYGIINKIIRTPDYDEIYFGFPPQFILRNRIKNAEFNKLKLEV